MTTGRHASRTVLLCLVGITLTGALHLQRTSPAREVAFDDEEGFCFEDMCIPMNAAAAREPYLEDTPLKKDHPKPKCPGPECPAHPPESVGQPTGSEEKKDHPKPKCPGPECPNHPPGRVGNVHSSPRIEAPSGKRTLLLSLCEPYHGSTALFQTLMSSPMVTTLCQAGHWQCEGHYIMTRHGYKLESNKWDWQRAVELFMKFWDTSKPVWVEKTPNLIQHISENHRNLQEANLPAKLQRLGIDDLEVTYIMMWRPVCLNAFSTHEETHDQRLEFNQFEEMVKGHRYLVSEGARVVVVSFADLIWRPKESVLRLNKLMPELGPLDPEFSAIPGVHVVPGNQWKAKGSVAEFGRSLDPASLRYDVESSSCLDGTQGFTDLRGEPAAQISEYVNYLRKVSDLQGV